MRYILEKQRIRVFWPYEEVLSRLILFGEGALRKVLNEYGTHYHQHTQTLWFGTDTNTIGRARVP